MSTTYAVSAQRDGKWWVLTAPEVPGAVAQARRLDQAPAEIGSAIAMLLGVAEDEVAVEVEVILDQDMQDRVRAVKAKQLEAERLRDEAAAASRELVVGLHGMGLTVRDIGAILGLSAQRAHQLLADGKPAGSGLPGSAMGLLSATAAMVGSVATAASSSARAFN